MISDGEKKYSDHALELAHYLDDKPISDHLKDQILDKLLIPYGLSDEKNGQQKLTRCQDKFDNITGTESQNSPKPLTNGTGEQKASQEPSLSDIIRKYPGELTVERTDIYPTDKLKDFKKTAGDLETVNYVYIKVHTESGKWIRDHFELKGAKA